MPPRAPRAGIDYPGSYSGLRAWFPTDAACLDYLDWLRWPDGFCCPVCRGTQAWKLEDGRRVAALAKRWLLGTHQGGVHPAHMQAYLDEFTFRFNRRRSRSRGMLFYRLLEQAVQAQPRTYRSLVASTGATTRQSPPPPPAGKRVRPASLAGEPLDRPWRR